MLWMVRTLAVCDSGESTRSQVLRKTAAIEVIQSCTWAMWGIQAVSLQTCSAALLRTPKR